MTNVPPTATSAFQHAEASGFSFARAFRSIGLSLFINAVMPYLIYRALEPHYPAGDITPLLASTIFPLFGLLLGILVRRKIDYVAIISLAEITISIIVTIVARDIRLALLARALQGTLTGLFILLTVPIGRPLLFYVARQFVAASSPKVLEGFETANRLAPSVFRLLTGFWGIGIVLASLVNLALAATVSPANYLLISPIVTTGTNVVLIALTIRYSTTRFRRLAQERASAQPK